MIVTMILMVVQKRRRMAEINGMGEGEKKNKRRGRYLKTRCYMALVERKE